MPCFSLWLQEGPAPKRLHDHLLREGAMNEIITPLLEALEYGGGSPWAWCKVHEDKYHSLITTCTLARNTGARCAFEMLMWCLHHTLREEVEGDSLKLEMKYVKSHFNGESWQFL